MVLHVVPPPQSHGEVIARQQGDGYHEDLWRMLDGLRAEDAALAVDCRLEDGPPADTILQVAREEGADLIVLGTQGAPAWGGCCWAASRSRWCAGPRAPC